MKKKCTIFTILACLFFACIPTSVSNADTGIDVTTLTDSVTPSESDSYQFTFDEEQTTLLDPIPIVVPNKGGLTFSIRQDEQNTKFSSLKIYLYKDRACTDIVDEAVLKSSSNSGNITFSVPAKRTYYMNFKLARSKGDTNPQTFYFSYGMIDGINTTLKNGKEMISYSDTGYKTIYYKVSTAKSGLLTLQLQHEALGEGTYVLCSKGKKPISNVSTFRTYEKQSEGGEKTYAVGKGTYYFKVTTTGAYRIKSSFTAKADGAGTSKSKATTIKVGSSKKGLILSSDPLSKFDWYKLTLTEPTKVSVIIDSKSNGTLQLSIDNLGGLHTVLVNSTKPKSGISSKGAWAKGDYYIKIGKNKSTASGEYTLSIVKQKSN